MEVAVRTDSRSVTATTPVAGSSTMAVPTGIFDTCLLSVVPDGRFFLAAGFFALTPARWTLDFAFFGVACFAAILRASLALALPRFDLFLRAATRFFAWAMAISSGNRRHGHLNMSYISYVALSPSDLPRGGDDPMRRDFGFRRWIVGASAKRSARSGSRATFREKRKSPSRVNG